MRRWIAATWIGIACVVLSSCGDRDPAGLGFAQPAERRECPQPGSGPGAAVIDWIDFVKLDGITYVADLTARGETVAAAAVGPLYGRVVCKVADNVTEPGYELQDGDAAFLPPGTKVYAIDGYEVGFRLAARRDGQWLVYEADTVPDAKQGSDLLDIRGRVVYIGINSVRDGTSELAAIRNPKRVNELVEMVLASPVDQNREPTNGDYERQRFVAFHLDDGTSTIRAFFPESRLLSRGIVVPPEFVEAIEQAS